MTCKTNTADSTRGTLLVTADETAATVALETRATAISNWLDALGFTSLTLAAQSLARADMVAAGKSEATARKIMERMRDALSRCEGWSKLAAGEKARQPKHIELDARGASSKTASKPASKPANDAAPAYTLQGCLAFIGAHPDDFRALIVQESDRPVFERIIAGMRALQSLRVQGRRK